MRFQNFDKIVKALPYSVKHGEPFVTCEGLKGHALWLPKLVDAAQSLERNEEFLESMKKAKSTNSVPEVVKSVDDLVERYTAQLAPEAVQFGHKFESGCVNCGERLELLTDGKTIWVSDEPCPYPNGFPSYKFELNVPSGKMVVGNDFRSGFPIVGSWSIDHVTGMAKTTEEYAKVGLAHAFVGNTCPGFYRISAQEFVIGTPSSGGRNPVPKSRRVAGVCTDLWWYSVADYDEFVRRYGKTPEDCERSTEVVKCEPGLYEFEHRYHLNEDDYKKAQVYTLIKRIGDPAPLQDHKSKYMSFNYTAEQVFHCLFTNGKDFYGSPEGYIKDSYAESVSNGYGRFDIAKAEWPFYFAADRLMACNGTGDGWHPNGWIDCSPHLKPDEPETEIPIFNKPYRWYPFSEHYCGLSTLVMSSHFEKEVTGNPSFVRLAFNVLQCILRYGYFDMYDEQKPEFRDKPTKPKFTGSLMKSTKNFYRLMVAKYGEPDFCAGLIENAKD